jgi:farnesyl diphosphate synthase
MDDDKIRRGKPSTHIKFGESTAVLAGNSLLTMAFEILSSPNLRLSEKIKINLIKKLSESSGYLGIAGGQYLDLSYEKKKVSRNQIIEMEIKKTGKLFSFCCAAPAIIKRRNRKEIKFFENIGSNIGLLFQIADDLIDFKGDSKKAGKKTGKDQKKGKATLISLLGYSNAIKYCDKIILDVNKSLEKYGSNSKNIKETLYYILNRDK